MRDEVKRDRESGLFLLRGMRVWDQALMNQGFFFGGADFAGACAGVGVAFAGVPALQ
jgi:hypothetical protein